MNKSDIEKMLEENVCTVKFEKTNGEKRTMKCTLVKDLLPEVLEKVIHPAETRYPHLKEESKRAQNDNIVAVYDLDKDGWRSFRISYLESIEVEK
jgi:hypothetical protein